MDQGKERRKDGRRVKARVFVSKLTGFDSFLMRSIDSLEAKFNYKKGNKQWLSSL